MTGTSGAGQDDLPAECLLPLYHRHLQKSREGRGAEAVAWFLLWVFSAIILVFFVIRVSTDAENIRNGADVPPGEFEARYADHPVVAYLHIVPGVAFLGGALHQLSTRMRLANPGRHRVLGRVLVASGLVSATFAIAFGVMHPYGGRTESSAAAVFGAYLFISLCIAARHARMREIVRHRRWMIRSVAIASGVATIRLIVGLAEATGLASFDDIFGPAFWIALSAHALAAEVWLRWSPTSHNPASPAMANP